MIEPKYRKILLTFVLPYYIFMCNQKKGGKKCHRGQADQLIHLKDMIQEYECQMKMFRFLKNAVGLLESRKQTLSEKESERYMQN